MHAEQYLFVGLGELLWDILPSGKQLGGAPANFAYIANALGNNAAVASRVGMDDAGHEALKRLRALNIKNDFVQIDDTRETGKVIVQVDADGQPGYDIPENVAWDALAFADEWQELAEQADVVCFGSLAQRTAHARSKIQRFLHATQHNALRIFDINLRPPFYTKEIIVASCELASIVKLNAAELAHIAEILELGDTTSDELTRALLLLEKFKLKLLCVTRGARGSLLVAPNDFHEHPGFATRVVDTIGAGDAFTATLAHFYVRGATLAQINEAANRTGAYIASHAGATPKIAADFLAQLKNRS